MLRSTLSHISLGNRQARNTRREKKLGWYEKYQVNKWAKMHQDEIVAAQKKYQDIQTRPLRTAQALKKGEQPHGLQQLSQDCVDFDLSCKKATGKTRKQFLREWEQKSSKDKVQALLGMDIPLSMAFHKGAVDYVVDEMHPLAIASPDPLVVRFPTNYFNDFKGERPTVVPPIGHTDVLYADNSIPQVDVPRTAEMTDTEHANLVFRERHQRKLEDLVRSGNKDFHNGINDLKEQGLLPSAFKLEDVKEMTIGANNEYVRRQWFPPVSV